ncbi:MAG: TRAP transporter small permease subunit [Planctomycetota bacterium]
MQWHLFSAAFLLGAAYTFQKNEHIRIDIINSRLSQNTRNVIELVGHVVFLLPFAGLLMWLGTSNAWRSFSSTGAVTVTQISFFVSLIVLGILIWGAVSYVPSLRKTPGQEGKFIPYALLVGVCLILDIYMVSNLMKAVQPFWEQSSSAGGLPGRSRW